jgi:hypothetical protein
MSQRSFHDHVYLELLKSSRTGGESSLACHIIDAHHQDTRSDGLALPVQIAENQRILSDTVNKCVTVLTELYFQNTQSEPSSALLALWRKQTIEIMFRAQ